MPRWHASDATSLRACHYENDSNDSGQGAGSSTRRTSPFKFMIRLLITLVAVSLPFAAFTFHRHGSIWGSTMWAGIYLGWASMAVLVKWVIKNKGQL